MCTLTRRGFIGALFAPAVVRVADLMPIKAFAVEPAPLVGFDPTRLVHDELDFTMLPPGTYDMVLKDIAQVEARIVASFLVKNMNAPDGLVPPAIAPGTIVRQNFNLKPQHEPGVSAFVEVRGENDWTSIMPNPLSWRNYSSNRKASHYEEAGRNAVNGRQTYSISAHTDDKRV